MIASLILFVVTVALVILFAYSLWKNFEYDNDGIKVFGVIAGILLLIYAGSCFFIMFSQILLSFGIEMYMQPDKYLGWVSFAFMCISILATLPVITAVNANGNGKISEATAVFLILLTLIIALVIIIWIGTDVFID